MSVSFQLKITPTGITNNQGERIITRLIYNLVATDETGATGDLGAPGILYLAETIPEKGATPATFTKLAAEILGPDNITVCKRIAENNLASFKGETLTGDC